MDFELTGQQKALQRMASEFAEAQFSKDYALTCDLNRRFPVEAYKKACEMGLIGVHFPREYGGGGLGVLEHVLVVEAFCRKDPGLGVAMSLRPFGSEMILKFGTDEQKSRILPRVIAGDMVTGAAFTEPTHGSDVTDLDTTAVRDGDDFVINGSKNFITNGLDAQVLTVLCKTDPEARPTHRGLSTILVETDRPGYSAEDLGRKMGQNMLLTTRVTLEGIKVPTGNLLGEPNRGFYQMLAFFDEARLAIAAQALGGAQAAFDRAVARVKERRQFGKRLADLQVTQHKIADMATKIEAARLMTYRAAWVADHQGVSPMLTSMAKVYAPRVAVEVAEETIQLFGGYGYFEDNEVERIYRDVRVMEIYEGSKEIQKNTIAGYLLGKE
jgi:alkylation response protein AidB-like acyl-CoA dehydrogenase